MKLLLLFLALSSVSYGAARITDADITTNAAIQISKLKAQSNNTVVGNVSGISAVPSAISQAQLTAIINPFTTLLPGAVPAGTGASHVFLHPNATWSALLAGDIPDISATYVTQSEVAQALGVASLDSSGKVPVAQLPSVVMEYQGAWNPNTNSPALSDATGTNGNVYYVTAVKAGAVAGLADPSMVNFQIGDLVIYSATAVAWQLASPSNGVQSVNTSQGAVTVNAINQLTGDVTAGPATQSQSKAATVAAIQGVTVSGTTGTGNVVFSASPALSTPNLGTPSALVGTNISGTASSLTAGHVTTNANLTGPITSAGNATSIAAQTGTGSTFAMQATPTFTTSVTDPLVIGGTGTTSTLSLMSTSGIGATGADIIFQTGNNGATEDMRILNSGSVGVGTASPVTKLHVSQDGAAVASTLYSSSNDQLTMSNTGFTQERLISAGTGKYPDVILTAVRGTLAAPTTMVNGDTAGQFLWQGFDGTGRIGEADITTILDAAVSTGVVPGALVFNTYPSGSAVERMRIASAGNVGIGTASPSAKLHVQGPSGLSSFTGTTPSAIQADGANAVGDYSGISFSHRLTAPSSRIAVEETGNGDYMQFGTSNNYTSGVTNVAITIDPTARVGISTASPGAVLEVNGSTKLDGTVTFSGIASAGTGNDFLCWNSSTGAVTESTTCSLSSIKIKKNVRPLQSGLAEVIQLRPVSYSLRPEYNPLHLKEQVGFIEEEVARVDSRLTTEDEHKDLNGVRYDKITAVLVKAVQEQQREIEELRMRCAQ